MQLINSASVPADKRHDHDMQETAVLDIDIRALAAQNNFPLGGPVDDEGLGPMLGQAFRLANGREFALLCHIGPPHHGRQTAVVSMIGPTVDLQADLRDILTALNLSPARVLCTRPSNTPSNSAASSSPSPGVP